MDSREPISSAPCKRIGLPGVLKTRRLGYDGKGQFVLRKRRRSIARAWAALGAAPLLYENLVPFDREVSIIGVRGRDGRDRVLSAQPRTCTRDGILRLHARALRQRGAARARRSAACAASLEHFDYVGVLTIEFFVRRGQLVANEMAPRVHNSGHWTIEGAETSQFENHVRAIAGLPLGSTRAARTLRHDQSHRRDAGTRAAAAASRACTGTTTARRRGRGASSVTAPSVEATAAQAGSAAL